MLHRDKSFGERDDGMARDGQKMQCIELSWVASGWIKKDRRAAADGHFWWW